MPPQQQSSCKAADEPATARYRVVVEPAVHDSSQPATDDPDVVVPSPSQDPADASQGTIDPLRHRLAPELESSSPGRRAVVREAEEVECLRSPLPALPTIGRCKPTELHQPGLVGVQLEPERGQPLSQVPDKPLRIPLVLEPEDKIIRISPVGTLTRWVA